MGLGVVLLFGFRERVLGFGDLEELGSVLFGCFVFWGGFVLGVGSLGWGFWGCLLGLVLWGGLRFGVFSFVIFGVFGVSGCCYFVVFSFIGGGWGGLGSGFFI